MTDSDANQTSGPGRKLSLIGIGAGDPDYVTAQAARAIEAFDVLFVVTKEADKNDLVQARTTVVETYRKTPFRTVELSDPPRPWKHAPHYNDAVAQWRHQRAEQWEQAIGEQLAEGEHGAFLVWGDPSLYESTLTVVQEVLRRGRVAFDYEVIPGVSSVFALAARHRIPLNRQGGAVQITPARLLAQGLPPRVSDIVVMLDPDLAFSRIEDDNIHIYWGAYLGTADEILIDGPLHDVRDEIVRVRAEAKLKKGWMFDTYLLRRTVTERRRSEVERRQQQVERQAHEIERRSGIDRRESHLTVPDLPPMPGPTEA
ncbi:MAG: precorrin-6A synthase (deacetylating) [Solirubrobacteraceae bacterium]|nr:precorrin-6A synthase (deacetylating) [Patulibacter sp.]